MNGNSSGPAAGFAFIVLIIVNITLVMLYICDAEELILAEVLPDANFPAAIEILWKRANGMRGTNRKTLQQQGTRT